ncbi:uncharacterized protein LOC111243679 isoform X2 [Varroa destructor]|uniref:Repulsive guidance molecule N-terminal domain-containing protein n=1 Tax=Varroa destructor TaxID=109461 RepID=A0A7M7M3G8_VARDE|nr:uncharacterized protein LOC111243679 isoform X2 [Varroa destructor]
MWKTGRSSRRVRDSYSSGDNCASDEGTLCMATLHTLQAKDGGDVTKLTVPELVARCAELRRNVACLLTHTQRCIALPEKRDQHAKVIIEARKYIATTCEADESVKAHWKDNKCYRQALLQRCDREFQDLTQQHKTPSNTPTNPQCEIFRQYQSCVQRMVASCSDDSGQFVALHLLDYGASLAWQCPNPEDPNGPNQGSGRHQANVIQTSGGGGSSSPLDPLGPQGPQESGGSQQGSGKNTGTTRKTMADIRRIPVIRDTHFTPPHKIEGMPEPSRSWTNPSHTLVQNHPTTRIQVHEVIESAEVPYSIIRSPAKPAAFSGNSGSTCVKLIQNDMRRCYNRYQRQESELKKQQSRAKSTSVASDAQQVDAKPKVCCAFGAYAHCLQTAVQTRCSQDREALVDTIIAQTLKLIGGHCEEYFYGSPKCSSGVSPLLTLTSSFIVLVALFATLPSLVVRTVFP